MLDAPRPLPERLQRRQQSYQIMAISLLRNFPLPSYERFAYLIFLGPPTHNCHAKPKTSRQKQNTHSKTENLMAKTKYLMAKPKPHGKNKIPHGKTETSRQKQKPLSENLIPHGKTKDLTAKPNTSQQKPNTSRQKQIPTAKPKLFCFCCEVFGFAVRFLVLPWRFWFCREVFCFCHEVFGFAVTVVGHHIHQSICYQIFEWKWNFKKHITYESSPFPIK